MSVALGRGMMGRRGLFCRWCFTRDSMVWGGAQGIGRGWGKAGKGGTTGDLLINLFMN